MCLVSHYEQFQCPIEGGSIQMPYNNIRIADVMFVQYNMNAKIFKLHTDSLKKVAGSEWKRTVQNRDSWGRPSLSSGRRSSI